MGGLSANKIMHKNEITCIHESTMISHGRTQNHFPPMLQMQYSDYRRMHMLDE